MIYTCPVCLSSFATVEDLDLKAKEIPLQPPERLKLRWCSDRCMNMVNKYARL